MCCVCQTSGAQLTSGPGGSRLCCTWCRTRRYQSEAAFGRKAKKVWEDEIGVEEYMPTDQVRKNTFLKGKGHHFDGFNT